MTTQPTRIVIGYDDSPDADVRPCGPRECPTFAASPCRWRSSWIGGAARRPNRPVSWWEEVEEHAREVLSTAGATEVTA